MISYQYLVAYVHELGEIVMTRNAEVKRAFDVLPITFNTFPLVTLRKTAWRMAIREMEWFLSGSPKCPDELLPWWKGQLNSNGMYVNGYASQLRNWNKQFDQVEALIAGLRSSPNSRRHMLTTWHASDMATITDANHNLMTPTCCHTTIAQFFVSQGKLHMSSYQRSADLLLGVPHNWVQSWALLLWLAHRAKLQHGTLRWMFGDAHIYQHPSHIACAQNLIRVRVPPASPINLVYAPPDDGSAFRAQDFFVEGQIPEPLVTDRPVLL